MMVKAYCELCGSEYMKKNGKSKYCSDKCKKEAYREKQRAWREQHPDYQRVYAEENPDAQERFKERHPNYYRDRSRKTRKSKKRECRCIVCGKPFATYVKHKWTCSAACKISYKSKRISNEQIVDTDITLEKLFERDNGTCYLCGKKCDWSDRNANKNAIGAMYPSIDHVFPIAKGGLHSWDNVKLAHVGCNASKRDRVVEGVI